MTLSPITCGAARRIAWESADATVLPVERGHAVTHIASCEQCKRFQADMVLLGSASARLDAEIPNDAFVAKLRRASSEVPRRRTLNRRLLFGLAAAAVVAVIARLPAGAPEYALTDTIAARQATLLAEPGIESAAPTVVQEWLNARLPQRVHVPTFENARLTGAAVVQFGRVSVAVIRFQVGSEYMTYTIAPALDDLASAPALINTRSTEASVVAWQDGMLQHVWIGAVAPQNLTTFARSCAEQAGRAMRTTGQTTGGDRPHTISPHMESNI